MNNNMKKIIFKINDYKKNKEKYGYSLSFNDSTIFNFLILPENIKFTSIDNENVIAADIMIFVIVNECII